MADNVFRGWDDENIVPTDLPIASEPAAVGQTFQGWDNEQLSAQEPAPPVTEQPLMKPENKWSPTPQEEIPPGVARQPFGQQTQGMENPEELQGMENPEELQGWGSWAAENVGPVVTSALPLMYISNPFLGAAISGLTYGGSNYIAKKIFGSPEESKEAFSNIPIDIGSTSFPTLFARSAAAVVPPQYKLPLSALAAGIGFWEGQVLGKAGKQVLQGKVPTTDIGTPMEALTNVALGVGAEIGIQKLGASVIDSVAPEFLPYAKSVAENSFVPALYQQLGSTKDRVLRFLGSSSWGKEILKQTTGEEAKQVVKTFLTKAGLPKSEGPINFATYIDDITAPMREVVGKSKKQMQELTDEVMDKYIPKEVRPRLLEDLLDYMRLANQQTESVKRTVRMENALKAIGAPEEQFNVIAKLPNAGTEQGFEEALKTLPDNMASSQQISKELSGALKPIHDYAESLYQGMTDKIMGTNAGYVPIQPGKFIDQVRKQSARIEMALDSMKFTAGPTVGITRDILRKVEAGKPLNAAEGLRLNKDLNFLLRSGRLKGEAKSVLGDLKSGLKEDMVQSLNSAGRTEEAALFNNANLQYAEMMDKLSFFEPKLNETIPGWKAGVPLHQTERDYLAAHSMFDTTKPENLAEYFQALGDPAAVKRIYQIRKQAEVRRLLEESTLGTTFDDAAFARKVKASKILSRNEKIDMGLEALPGKMEEGEALSSLKSSLLQGDKGTWAKARKGMLDFTGAPQDLEGWAIHERLFKRSVNEKGNFDLNKFMVQAKLNKRLVDELGLADMVKMVESKQSLFNLPKGRIEGVLKAFDKTENMPQLAELFFTENQTFNPQSVSYLFKLLPKQHAESLRYEIFNHMVRQGGSDINLPQTIARVQRIFNKDARIGIDKPTTEAIYGKERATVIHNMVTALNRLNSFGHATEDVVAPAILEKMSKATPSFTTTGTLGTIAGFSSWIPLNLMLLKDMSVMRNITKVAYQTLTKLKSENKRNEE